MPETKAEDGVKEKRGMRMEYLVDGVWQLKSGIVSAVRVLNARGAGFLISLNAPCPAAVGAKQEKNGQTLLPLRFRLGNSFDAGQNVPLKYTIKPIR